MIDSAYKLMKSLLKLADSDYDEVWFGNILVELFKATAPFVLQSFL